MKLPLRIAIGQFGLGTMTWGTIEYRVTGWAKTTAGCYVATIQCEEWSPSRIIINPAEGRFVVDGIAHHLRDWRVEGRVATAETEDFGPGYEAEMGG